MLPGYTIHVYYVCLHFFIRTSVCVCVFNANIFFVHVWMDKNIIWNYVEFKNESLTHSLYNNNTTTAATMMIVLMFFLLVRLCLLVRSFDKFRFCCFFNFTSMLKHFPNDRMHPKMQERMKEKDRIEKSYHIVRADFISLTLLLFNLVWLVNFAFLFY